jgi:Cdc6-like AAA superfamily ATPase
MEAVGAAASIVQVLQISEQVVSACYQYYRTARGAKTDILQVINIVGGLKSTLENLRPLITTAEGSADQPDPRLPHLAASLKSCQEALQSIERKLCVNPTVNLNFADVKVGLVKHLTWPWKEKEVEKILGVIEKQKTIFILALSGDTLETVLSIQDTAEGVRNTTSSIQNTVEGLRNTTASIHGAVEGVRSTALSIQETVGGVRSSVDTAAITERHAKILNWIKLSDPSSNHNAARTKHQPTTGTWFLESEQFVSWIEGRIKSIWIHGIPGAGKTILSSTVIDQVDAVCKLDSAQQYAYFYFDFNDANKRTVDGMLRSMIQQLSVLTLFPEVDNLYQHCGQGTNEPAQEVLVETLVSLFQLSDRTFLIVDALDECSDSERDDLLDVITKITQAQQVGLLATSCNERDIARSLQRTVENVTSLQEGDGIADDISLHVQKCLQEDIRLREWPLKIKEEIQMALINGAHGM